MSNDSSSERTVMPIGEVIGHKEMGLALVQWKDSGIRPIGTLLYAAPQQVPSAAMPGWDADSAGAKPVSTAPHFNPAGDAAPTNAAPLSTRVRTESGPGMGQRTTSAPTCSPSGDAAPEVDGLLARGVLRAYCRRTGKECPNATSCRLECQDSRVDKKRSDTPEDKAWADRYYALAAAADRLYFAGYWHADRPVDEQRLWTALRDAAGIAPGQTTKVLGPERGTNNQSEIEEALWALHSYESNRQDGGRVYSEADITRMVEAVRTRSSTSFPEDYQAFNRSDGPGWDRFTVDSIDAAGYIYEDCKARGRSQLQSMTKAVGRLIERTRSATSGGEPK